MWAFICTLALSYTNVRGRPDSYNKWREDKTKQNRDETTRRLWTCRGHSHLLRLQSYWYSPHLRYATHSHDVPTPAIQQHFRIAGVTPNMLCFITEPLHCPVGRMFSRCKELAEDSAVIGFWVWTHTWRLTWSTAFLPWCRGCVMSSYSRRHRFHLLPT